jgi:hypothetical protein
MRQGFAAEKPLAPGNSLRRSSARLLTIPLPSISLLPLDDHPSNIDEEQSSELVQLACSQPTPRGCVE